MNEITETTPAYGTGDSSYQAAGGIDGITKLVNSFYDYMDTLPEASELRAMHAKSLDESRRKLSYFLSGWLGGPRLYKQNYGSIVIPQAHAHMNIGEKERDDWMMCMRKAIADQPFTDDFKQYLEAQLFIPAERTRVVCQRHRQA